jgi:LacI family transcriptional regulator
MAKINQQYIAESLDLSITTVSRCFTNHPKINPETRAKVLKFAVEHGYSYNAFRNQKPTRKAENGRIAVLVGVSEKFSDAAGVAGKIFAGITSKAASLDYRVDLFYIDPTTFKPNMRSRRIIPGSSHNNWTGIVLVFPFLEEAVQELSTKFHVISVLDEYEESPIDSINPDQGRGIAKMVKHLHQLGHKKLGFMSWRYTTVDTPWVQNRLGSFVEHLFRFGLEFDPTTVLFLPENEARDPERGADQVIQKMNEGMTGLICAADHQAYELIPKLKSKGVRIPEDISITGYDGIPTPHGLPQLTTYNTPFQEVGNSGLVSLQRRIDHPLASRSHILIDGEMVAGETTQALRN